MNANINFVLFKIFSSNIFSQNLLMGLIDRSQKDVFTQISRTKYCRQSQRRNIIIQIFSLIYKNGFNTILHYFSRCLTVKAIVTKRSLNGNFFLFHQLWTISLILFNLLIYMYLV